MFHNLAVDIAFLMIKNKIVDIQQRDIYVYGLEVLLFNGSLLSVFLIASLLCGEMINFLAYFIFFLPLRLFSGGYHAEKSESCFVLSTIMYDCSNKNLSAFVSEFEMDSYRSYLSYCYSGFITDGKRE